MMYYAATNDDDSIGDRMPLGQRFDAAKAIEAILYISRRVSDASFHRISKILYFAEKHKLATGGGLIIADEYVAMKHGPVPSQVYDILKSVRGDGHHPGARNAAAAFTVVEGCRVVPSRAADLDYFSKADLSSLDCVIAQFGDLPFQRLTDLSHDSAWVAADENEFMNLVDIAKATSAPEKALASVEDRFSLAS
jgi:uncharacterized phage-associated protein